MHTQLSYKTQFVDCLPDLITEEDYQAELNHQKIRIRISPNGEDIEILGDSMYAKLIEDLLVDLGASEIERMLCG